MPEQDLTALKRMLNSYTHIEAEQLYLFRHFTGVKVASLEDITPDQWEGIKLVIFPDIAEGDYRPNMGFHQFANNQLRVIKANNGYQEKLPGF